MIAASAAGASALALVCYCVWQKFLRGPAGEGKQFVKGFGTVRYTVNGKELTFKTGSTGFTQDAATGKVLSVEEGSEADVLGVKAGWTIVQVNGARYSKTILEAARAKADASGAEITTTFRTEAEIGSKPVVLWHTDVGAATEWLKSRAVDSHLSLDFTEELDIAEQGLSQKPSCRSPSVEAAEIQLEVNCDSQSLSAASQKGFLRADLDCEMGESLSPTYLVSLEKSDI